MDTKAGQAIYSQSVLRLYDAWVLGFSNSYLWKCPTTDIEDFFGKHLSDNHLDIGVGTGYYLDKLLRPNQRRIALLDLNENSLQVASARINRFQPECHRTDVFKPLALPGKQFTSISINYLLHCLPGNFRHKALALNNIKPLLTSDGTLFGSTILSEESAPNSFAKRLMRFYNKKGIFSNKEDTFEELSQILHQEFTVVELRQHGAVALFAVRI